MCMRVIIVSADGSDDGVNMCMRASREGEEVQSEQGVRATRRISAVPVGVGCVPIRRKPGGEAWRTPSSSSTS